MKPESSLELFPATDGTGPSLDLERSYWTRGFAAVAGVDEAGRGCLCGPVVAAAVILPVECQIPGVDDSKTLSATARANLAAQIRETAVAVSTGQCSAKEIDELNILQASLEAMRRAVAGLSTPPDRLLIDGNICFSNPSVPSKAIVKGDALSQTIAAASIIAKTSRDKIMYGLHVDYPQYGWITNVGYPTAAHYKALAQYGPTRHHRRSFRLS